MFQVQLDTIKHIECNYKGFCVLKFLWIIFIHTRELLLRYCKQTKLRDDLTTHIIFKLLCKKKALIQLADKLALLGSTARIEWSGTGNGCALLYLVATPTKQMVRWRFVMFVLKCEKESRWQKKKTCEFKAWASGNKQERRGEHQMLMLLGVCGLSWVLCCLFIHVSWCNIQRLKGPD